MFRPARAVLILTAFLCLFSAAAFSLMIKLPLERLTQESDRIVLGRVEDLRCEWNKNRDLIFTIVTLRIREVWKGQILLPSVIIQIPGGTMGDLSLCVSDTAVFHRGEEVLVFLRENQDPSDVHDSLTATLSPSPSFSVNGWAQGKYSIDQYGVARKGGYTVLSGEQEQDRIVPLSLLKKRVKVFLEAGARLKRGKDEKDRF